MVAELFGDKKIPLVFAFIGVLTVIALHQWVNVTFVTTVQAEQSLSSLSAKIDNNGSLLREHIDEYKLSTVKRDIQTLRDQQYDLTVMVEQNGESSLSRKRGTELLNRLLDLEKKERCITNGNKFC